MDKKEIKELSKIILVELSSNYEFVKADWLDIPITQTETSGLFLRKFLLSEVLRWTNKEEHQKEQLIDVLNTISGRGKLAIFWMGITREMDYLDLAFRCWIGEGIEYFEKNIFVPQVRAYRIYSDGPLTKLEKEKLRVLPDIKKEAILIWERRNNCLKSRYRSHDLKLEYERHLKIMTKKAI